MGMMRKTLIIIMSLCPFFLQAQQKKNVYWVENNIQINFRGSLIIQNHDLAEFNASSDDFKLTIKKRELNLPKDQIKEFIVSVLNNMGYSVSGEVKYSYKDFLTTTWCQAQKEGYWGIFFLLKEELNGDNYFVGYLTTASKPTIESIRLVENFKVVEDGTLSSSDYNTDDQSPDVNYAKRHNELLSLMQKYSPEIFSVAEYYYKLPTELNGEKLNEHYEIAESFKDSISYQSLYYHSNFIYNLIYRLNGHISDIAEFESLKTNEDRKFFSIQNTIDKRVDIEKFQTPPASIIHRTYPEKFKGLTYADCIFPSSLNRSTQINGIFSLESEYIATCYQVKWYNDFLKYYYENGLTNSVFYLEYIYLFPGISYDALLYKHYIIKYLSVVKTEMPEVYSTLLGKADFRFLITSYFAIFDQSIRDFNTNKIKIRNEIGDQYIPYIEDETKLVIDSLQYSNNDKLVLFNSLVDFIDAEPTYQQVLTDFEIAKGEKIVMIKE
jgi:hypothetical protein